MHSREMVQARRLAEARGLQLRAGARGVERTWRLPLQAEARTARVMEGVGELTLRMPGTLVEQASRCALGGTGSRRLAWMGVSVSSRAEASRLEGCEVAGGCLAGVAPMIPRPT